MAWANFNEKKLTRRNLLLGAVATGYLTVTDSWGTAYAAKIGGDIAHGPRTSNQVALTFHASGDLKLAEELFSLLESNQVPVSIFGVGSWLAANPNLTARALTNGYDLGNHTYSHLAMKTLGAAKVKSEILDCAKVLTKEIGYAGKWFRPSGTQYSNSLIRKVAREYGYSQCISYDVDSLDYTDPGASKVINAVGNNVKGGSIISMHFGHAVTIKALPTILKDLGNKGLTPVTLTDLLKPMKISPAQKVIKG